MPSTAFRLRKKKRMMIVKIRKKKSPRMSKINEKMSKINE